MDWQPTLGAILLDDNQCEFRVWSPYAKAIDVHLIGGEDERMVSMARVENDTFRAVVENILPGQLYRYRLDGKNEYPDPVSRSQPDGVNGASAVVDQALSVEGGKLDRSAAQGLPDLRNPYWDVLTGGDVSGGDPLSR